MLGCLGLELVLAMLRCEGRGSVVSGTAFGPLLVHATWS